MATVAHHEIAHTWFGDLVTMEWWDGAWLNEGFTTFMELLSIDHYRPAWNRWTTFGSTASRLSVDGLHGRRPIDCHVESPHDAEEMFDVLNVQEGRRRGSGCSSSTSGARRFARLCAITSRPMPTAIRLLATFGMPWTRKR